MKLIALPLLLALAISGCASSYEPPAPSSKNIARVRVAQSMQGAQLLAMELPGACLPNMSMNTGYRHIATLAGSQVTLAPHRRAILGIPDPQQPEGSYSEFYVATDKPFHLGTYFESSVTMRAVTSRTVAVTFQPQPGADYEAVLTPMANRCNLVINKLSVSDKVVTRAPVEGQQIGARCN